MNQSLNQSRGTDCPRGLERHCIRNQSKPRYALQKNAPAITRRTIRIGTGAVFISTPSAQFSDQQPPSAQFSDQQPPSAQFSDQQPPSAHSLFFVWSLSLRPGPPPPALAWCFVLFLF
uniref:Uncharacterized protein n=1 Tax=Astatotilapia calliptera TaxID=8154 RepID=A0AAX7UQG7_ASTCA